MVAHWPGVTTKARRTEHLQNEQHVAAFFPPTSFPGIRGGGVLHGIVKEPESIRVCWEEEKEFKVKYT